MQNLREHSLQVLQNLQANHQSKVMSCTFCLEVMNNNAICGGFGIFLLVSLQSHPLLSLLFSY